MIEGRSPTTVYVIAAVLLYRESMQEILGRYPDIDVVGVGANVRSELPLLAALEPQLVLVDSPSEEAFDVVAAIRGSAPLARVVALGVGDVDSDVITWAEAGVSGYLTRDEPLSTLVSVIHAVARGELLCSPRLAATLLRHVAHSTTKPTEERLGRRLTLREQEVLTLLRRGLSNKEIAYRLAIALPTVKNHVHNILGKLEVRGRCEAVACTNRG